MVRGHGVVRFLQLGVRKGAASAFSVIFCIPKGQRRWRSLRGSVAPYDIRGSIYYAMKLETRLSNGCSLVIRVRRIGGSRVCKYNKREQRRSAIKYDNYGASCRSPSKIFADLVVPARSARLVCHRSFRRWFETFHRSIFVFLCFFFSYVLFVPSFLVVLSSPTFRQLNLPEPKARTTRSRTPRT